MAVTVAGRGVNGPSRRGTGVDVSEREDLANFISMITRDETPFMSSIGKTKATAIYHEWQTDQLQAPGNSRVAEGQDFLIPGVTAAQNPVVGAQFAVVGDNRTRLGNYTQINGKTIAVSGTRRAVDQAGVADEYAYQLKKRGTEMRRDIELDLLGTNVSAAFSPSANLSGTGRTFGGYQSFINVPFATSNTAVNGGTVMYTGNASAPGTVGNGTAAPTYDDNEAGAALSLTDIDAVMQAIYEEGGKATKIMVSPKLRRDFSDLLVSDTGVRRNIDMDGKLRQAVDIYMSDFGDLMIMPNYIMGLGDISNQAAFIYDPMWFNIATLRPLQEVDVGQRGDSTVGMMVEECSLEVRNPIGCGAIYGLA